MGKIAGLSVKQLKIFKDIAKDSYFKKNFYFTGGTALSVVHLKHRFSEDLDFFSASGFDSQSLVEKIEDLAQKHSLKFKSRQIEKVFVYELEFPDGEVLKVDFVIHPHKLLEKTTKLYGFAVDSLIDMAVNKLLTINQRTEVKDFVDLYFLLEKFTIWDLMDGLKVKYRIKTDPLIVAGDFLKIESLEVLPIMIKPLKLSELKDFFRENAKKLGRLAVE